MDDTEALIYPLGDLHIGAVEFGKMARERLKSLIIRISRQPKARLVLMGDLLNMATRVSKSSPYEQTMDADGQMEYAVRLFRPVSGQIIAAIDGNHEYRLREFAGMKPVNMLMKLLGRESAYAGYSAYINLRVRYTGVGSQSYTIYAHHTKGGGKTLGAPFNVLEGLRRIANAQVYLGGHTHNLGSVSRPIVEKGRFRLLTYVACGSWIEWNNSYAEAGMFPPARLGSAVLTFPAKERRVGVEV